MARNVRELVQERLGAVTAERSSIGTVGTTAARLVTNNPRRLLLVVTNLSTGTLYVDVTPGVSSTRGIAINPAISVSFAWFEDFTLPTREWYAVGSAADLAYSVLEQLMEAPSAP